MLALHKLLLDYKFHLDRRNELFASQLLADLSHRLIEGLVALDREVKGDDSRALWVAFLTVDDLDHSAAHVVTEALKNVSLWAGWSTEERFLYLRAAFSPYLPTPAILEALAFESSFD